MSDRLGRLRDGSCAQPRFEEELRYDNDKLADALVLTGCAKSQNGVFGADWPVRVSRAGRGAAMNQPEDDPIALDECAIAERARLLWYGRGCPIGSPEVDWLRAEEEIGDPTREIETSAYANLT